ncbi:MAG: LLM class F420-dependent oxidoreductase [Acidimicrobiia bacterium]|jgi:probable F420-dependent oxidoreductase
MKLGVTMFATDTAISPVLLAQEVEQRGFESLWLPEHSHIPTSRATPRGGVKGADDLPEKYWRTFDAFVALAAIASVTSRIKLATGICLVAQRDPIWLAKEVASLDTLSGGRFLFGIGYGWNKEEMAQHGIAYRERRRILREKILAMKALWTDDVASFDGDFVHVEPSWAWPKPVQRPHPPIILGGDAGPRTRADIVEFCDGWMPLGGRHPIVERIAQIRADAEAAGRDPAGIEITLYGAPADPGSLADLAQAGVHRAILTLPSDGAAAVLPLLDAHARLLDQIP